MSEEEFDKIIEESCANIKQTLVVKGKEYRRNNNVFHVFEQAARIANITREKAMYGFALKHQVSIADIRNDLDKGILPTLEILEEKYSDAVNYLLLEKASIIDRIYQADYVSRRKEEIV